MSDIRALAGRAVAVPLQAAAAAAQPVTRLDKAATAVKPPPVAIRRSGLGTLPIGLAPGGLDRATWQRFRSGSLGVERRLDLHGQTASHAFRLFEQVLTRSSADGLRCLEVITGRGAGELGGILRRELPHWINLPHLRPLILAATHPHEGNTGSMRLLLRRPPHATAMPRTRR